MKRVSPGPLLRLGREFGGSDVAHAAWPGGMAVQAGAVGLHLKENRIVFDRLLERRAQIEADFDGPLVWDTLEQRQRCEMEANVFEREDWSRMIVFMSDAMMRLERTFRDPLRQIGAELRARGPAGELKGGMESES